MPPAQSTSSSQGSVACGLAVPGVNGKTLFHVTKMEAVLPQLVLVFFMNPIGASKIDPGQLPAVTLIRLLVSHSQLRWLGVAQGGVDPVFPFGASP